MTHPQDVAVPSLPEPCPFCGAAARFTQDGGNDERSGYNFRVYVGCTKCGATIKTESHQNKNGWCDDSGQAKREALEAWNRRAAGRAAAEPEGFVLVPRVPTPVMMRVGLLSMWPRAAYQSGAVENVWIRMCRVGADPSTEEMTLKAIAAAPTPTASIAPKAEGEVPVPNVDAMVDRFLGWPLPKTFAPDCGISFDGRKDDEWNKGRTWPVGTNLFTAHEARAMFEHALAAPVAQAAAGATGEGWIVVKEHAWDQGDGERPTLAYLWPAEFNREVFPTLEAARQFLRKPPGLPLGWVTMKITTPQAKPAPRPEADADRASGGGV